MSSSSSGSEEGCPDQNETRGPKRGVKISLEQANFIIRRHFENRKAISLQHINEGYNHRVYIVTTASVSSNGNDEVSDLKCQKEDYILRLGGRIWTRYKTENEVAALLLMGKKESVPVPKIFGYCTDRLKSGINAEYILMEKVDGVHLSEIWKELDQNQKVAVVDQLAKIFAAIQHTRSDKIGRLRFHEDPIGSSNGIGIDPDANIPDPSAVIEVSGGVDVEEGPYSTFLEYVKGDIEQEIRKLKRTPFMQEAEGYEKRLERLERFVKVFGSLETVPEGIDREALVNVPVVFTHSDLHDNNILINPETLQITGIIDWEHSGFFPVDMEWFTGFDFLNLITADTEAFKEFEKPEDIKKNEEYRKSEMGAYFLEKVRELGVIVPDDMPRSAHLERAQLLMFAGFICPWWLREKRDPHPKRHFNERRNATEKVDNVLSKYGF